MAKIKTEKKKIEKPAKVGKIIKITPAEIDIPMKEQEEEEILIPTVVVLDLATKKTLKIEVHDEFSSVSIGKETVNVTAEQAISVIMFFQDRLAMINNKKQEEEATDEN